MRQKIFSAILLSSLTGLFILYESMAARPISVEMMSAPVVQEERVICISTEEPEVEVLSCAIEDENEVTVIIDLEPSKEPEPEIELSENDIDLIALVTMAEAEGESEEGKRLVIDTILNRMEHEKFPSTANGVIYQKHQFSSMWNGRVNRCYVREDICQLVKEEMFSRKNRDTIFFTAGHYSSYGKPLFQVGGHYFSSYN